MQKWLTPLRCKKPGVTFSMDCHIRRKSYWLGQYSLSFQGSKISNSIEKQTRFNRSVYSFKESTKKKLLSKQDNDSDDE